MVESATVESEMVESAKKRKKEESGVADSGPQKKKQRTE